MEATLSNRTPDASPEAIVRIRLQRMVGLLCEDAARVELWACALSGFARPIPDHDDWRVKKRYPNQGPRRLSMHLCRGLSRPPVGH
jgi:hypothetical protein